MEASARHGCAHHHLESLPCSGDGVIYESRMFCTGVFSWDEYLAENEGVRAPQHCFKQVSFVIGIIVII